MKRPLFLAATVFICAASSWATLTPAQLTPQERATYNGLASNSDKARSFLATREYVRICQTTTPANASKLPDIPKNYDGTYVTLKEQKIVDDALDMSFAALIDGRR
ncbi:MAG: hypothetical protein ACHQ2Z_03795 [Elusimicrobiota bacterium]